MGRSAPPLEAVFRHETKVQVLGTASGGWVGIDPSLSRCCHLGSRPRGACQDCIEEAFSFPFPCNEPSLHRRGFLEGVVICAVASRLCEREGGS